MLEWEKEGVNVTKAIEVQGKWGDCPLPLLSECKLCVNEWNGPVPPSSKVKSEEIYVTGFARCLEDRLIELALCSMLEGEEALITINKLNIKVRLTLVSFKNSSPIPDWSQDFSIEVAQKLKQTGVDIFQQGLYQDAFYLFSDALKVLILCECDCKELLSTLNCNLAACQLHANNNKHAIELCDITLKLQPDNRKALYRKALAAFNIGEYGVAKLHVEKVLSMEPKNSQAKELLANVIGKTSKGDVAYKTIMHKMFN